MADGTQVDGRPYASWRGDVRVALRMTRTEWAEQVAADLASKPLLQEFVFKNPKYQDATEKEVCDLLLTLRNDAIPVQMKCQEDPNSRAGKRLERWIVKRAPEALGQLLGTIRSIRERNFWCEHPRRRRVEFAKGQLSVIHGVVLVEHTAEPIQLAADLPIEHQGVPIHYFAANDFLNIVNELRSFPDLVAYLGSRRSLSPDFLRSTGGEREAFEYFLSREGRFGPASSLADMRMAMTGDQEGVRQIIRLKKEADRPASLVEYIADSLATRSPHYTDGLGPELLASFDHTERRSNYLLMQEELGDLCLDERRKLGGKLFELVGTLDAGRRAQDMTFAVCCADSKPDFLYLLVASRGLGRKILLPSSVRLLRGALAFYRKKDGMSITDRDGASFEVALVRKFVPTASDGMVGQRFFGSLKMFGMPVNLVPAPNKD